MKCDDSKSKVILGKWMYHASKTRLFPKEKQVNGRNWAGIVYTGREQFLEYPGHAYWAYTLIALVNKFLVRSIKCSHFPPKNTLPARSSLMLLREFYKSLNKEHIKSTFDSVSLVTNFIVVWRTQRIEYQQNVSRFNKTVNGSPVNSHNKTTKKASIRWLWV